MYSESCGDLWWYIPAGVYSGWFPSPLEPENRSYDRNEGEHRDHPTSGIDSAVIDMHQFHPA